MRVCACVCPCAAGGGEAVVPIGLWPRWKRWQPWHAGHLGSPNKWWELARSGAGAQSQLQQLGTRWQLCRAAPWTILCTHTTNNHLLWSTGQSLFSTSKPVTVAHSHWQNLLSLMLIKAHWLQSELVLVSKHWAHVSLFTVELASHLPSSSRLLPLSWISPLWHNKGCSFSFSYSSVSLTWLPGVLLTNLSLNAKCSLCLFTQTGFFCSLPHWV